jgi:hypothetical protein
VLASLVDSFFDVLLGLCCACCGKGKKNETVNTVGSKLNLFVLS